LCGARRRDHADKRKKLCSIISRCAFCWFGSDGVTRTFFAPRTRTFYALTAAMRAASRLSRCARLSTCACITAAVARWRAVAPRQRNNRGNITLGRRWRLARSLFLSPSPLRFSPHMMQTHHRGGGGSGESRRCCALHIGSALRQRAAVLSSHTCRYLCALRRGHLGIRGFNAPPALVIVRATARAIYQQRRGLRTARASRRRTISMFGDLISVRWWLFSASALRCW